MTEYFTRCVSLFGDTITALLGNDYFRFFFTVVIFLMVLFFILRLSRFLGGD